MMHHGDGDKIVQVTVSVQPEVKKGVRPVLTYLAICAPAGSERGGVVIQHPGIVQFVGSLLQPC
jgi:hypothetical protein